MSTVTVRGLLFLFGSDTVLVRVRVSEKLVRFCYMLLPNLVLVLVLVSSMCKSPDGKWHVAVAHICCCAAHTARTRHSDEDEALLRGRSYRPTACGGGKGLYVD